MQPEIRISSPLILNHQMDDFFIGACHASVRQGANGADRVLDPLLDDSLAGKELVLAAPHLKAEKPGIYCRSNFCRTGSFGAIAIIPESMATAFTSV